MISFFLISLPTFGVIGVGWAATRTRLVAQGALDALNAFSFRFALPALLLRLIAGQPLRQSFNPEFYTGYLASGAIIFVLVLGTSRVVAARDLSTAGAHATTATVSNLGFLGPPLMLAFFGERGAGPLAMAILAEVMVLLSVGSVLMGANGGPKSGIGSLILRGTMFNPIVVAIVLGQLLRALVSHCPRQLRASSAFSAVRPARRHSSRSAGPSLCSVSTAEPPLPRA